MSFAKILLSFVTFWLSFIDFQLTFNIFQLNISAIALCYGYILQFIKWLDFAAIVKAIKTPNLFASYFDFLSTKASENWVVGCFYLSFGHFSLSFGKITEFRQNFATEFCAKCTKKACFIHRSWNAWHRYARFGRTIVRNGLTK